MPLYACPNCGLTESSAPAAPEPGPCPRCCARMKPTADIGWQRWPTQPFPADRPRVRLALSPSAEAPTFARRAVAGLAGELTEDETFTVQLLLSELVTNVVLHAGSLSPARATATVWVGNDRVRGDVLDRGEGFRPRVTTGDPGEAESGWGLRLVDQLADDWGVVPGSGSWVWFELFRDPRELAQPRSTRRSDRTGTSGGSVDWSNRINASAPRLPNPSRTSSRYERSTTATPRATAPS
jgi:anti-sigma regulatory factor (Ser/Thr protein kinase)